MLRITTCLVVCSILLFGLFAQAPLIKVFAQSGTRITFERTATGFFYPTGINETQFGPTCGTWLGGDGSTGHPGCYRPSGVYHIGVDILGHIGDPVYAISRGTVVKVNTSETWENGNVGLFVKHTLDDGTEFLALYAHIQTDLQEGNIVTGGVQIGTIGLYSGGNHIHFAIHPSLTVPTNNIGRMPNSSWPASSQPDTNGFVDPINWIKTRTPKCESGTSERYMPSGRLPLHPNGTLVKTRDNDTVYVLQGGQRRAIPSAQRLYELYGPGRGFDFRDVITISSQEMQRYNPGPDVNEPLPNNNPHEPDGRLIKPRNSGEISIVTNHGTRFPFRTGEAFLNLGYSLCNVATVEDYNVDPYPVGPAVEDMQNISASGGFDPIPTFTSTATASPNPASPNESVTIPYSITNTTGTANDAIVNIEIYNSSNQKVYQTFVEHQSFSTNQTRNYGLVWLTPVGGQYTVKLAVFNSSWTVNYHWNDNAVTLTIGTAPPPTSAQIDIWWPTDSATVSGTQPFKALLQNYAVENYNMYWQVDGGGVVSMYNSYQDYPHKEAIVDLSGWTWRGNGPYTVNFVAKDANGNILAQRAVNITVVH